MIMMILLRNRILLRSRRMVILALHHRRIPTMIWLKLSNVKYWIKTQAGWNIQLVRVVVFSNYFEWTDESRLQSVCNFGYDSAWQSFCRKQNFISYFKYIPIVA